MDKNQSDSKYPRNLYGPG